MAKPKRVHQIAKELGVNSKAIVAKCQEEGVPGIENHMSAVKLGLYETIRGWFADAGADEAPGQGESIDEGATATAAATEARTTQSTEESTDEPSADQPSAKKPAKKKAAKKKPTKKKAQPGQISQSKTTGTNGKSSSRAGQSTKAKTSKRSTQAGESESARQTETPASTLQPAAEAGPGHPQANGEGPTQQTSEQPQSQTSTETDQGQTDLGAQPEAASDQSQPVAGTAIEQSASAQRSGEGDEAGASSDQSETAESQAPANDQGPRAKPNVPRRPDVVKPAGEQLTQPKSAQLRGPKVVRVEQADQIRAPRPRSRGGGANENQQRGGRDYGNAPGVTRAKGPTRGGGVKGKSGGNEDADGGGGGGGKGGQRSNKRRSRTSRRGRSGDSLPTGPAQFSEADMEELDARLKGSAGFVKKHRQTMRKRDGAGPAQTAAMVGGKVEIAEPITIKNLSAATGIKTADIIKHLFAKGIMATINSSVENEMALEIALEYDIELDIKEQQTAQQRVEQEFEAREVVDSQSRPPVVTVLGHVDHGKTSLLDKIRKADVATSEFGGITQHVGAYRVTITGADGQDKTVVFLDTPGHAAFTTMRSRGAKMTDLVVLVIAADDGVMPQTVESINHAKAAGVPIVVALNKSDLAQATDENIHRIYGQLAEHGLNPAEWGGQTEIVKTSAEVETGISELVETLDYQAELLEVTADYAGPARGTVIEAEMQTGRGSVARTLVQEGQLSVGDFIVSGRAYGRVRDMTDDRGRSVQQVGPATPVELSGLDEIPDAGDKFYITDTLKKAQDVANQFRHIEREQMLASRTKVTLDNFAEAVKAGQMRELRVVLKADVQGSVETIEQQLSELGNSEVGVKVLHSAVGTITESDVVLADASDGIVVGFHTGITPAVREIADQRKVELRQYRVIYELIDDIKSALEGMLDPEVKEEELGVASVKEVFRISKLGNIAGCLVTDGMMKNSAKVRVIRDGQMVTEGRDVASLRRVKDEVREIRSGTECGIRVDAFDDVKPDDLLVCYDQVEVQRTLD